MGPWRVKLLGQRYYWLELKFTSSVVLDFVTDSLLYLGKFCKSAVFHWSFIMEHFLNCGQSYSIFLLASHQYTKPGMLSLLDSHLNTNATLMSFLKDLFVLFYVYECSICMCMILCQKRALEPTIDGCEPPCGFWELSTGPVEKQPVSHLYSPIS